MKKYIFILDALELMTKLIVGKRVEGVLYMDENTGRLTFKAYNRKNENHKKDCLVKKLPWGWVKESKERFKVYESVPKSLGLEELVLALDDEHKTATDAIIDYAIIERV